MDMPLCAEERPSFLGRSGRVSFNDLYIPRGGGRRGGKRRGGREGENEQGP